MNNGARWIFKAYRFDSLLPCLTTMLLLYLNKNSYWNNNKLVDRIYNDLAKNSNHCFRLKNIFKNEGSQRPVHKSFNILVNLQDRLFPHEPSNHLSFVLFWCNVRCLLLELTSSYNNKFIDFNIDKFTHILLIDLR